MRRVLAILGFALLALTLVLAQSGDIAIASHQEGPSEEEWSEWWEEWWRRWGNNEEGGTTTSTTTTAPPPTTTTAPTTTTTAPTTTTTTAPTTTTTTAPTPTTTAPTTTTKVTQAATLAPTSTTSTTSTTTTTTTTVPENDEAVVFLVAPHDPPGDTTPTGVGSADPVLGLIVSLGSAFVSLTIDALAFPLLAFAVPALVAIWLSIKERDRDPRITDN